MTAPDLLERFLRRVQQALVAREQPRFEVAPVDMFGAEPCAGPVGAAQIQMLAIHDHELQVRARTQAQLQAALYELLLPIKIALKHPRWQRGVQDPQLYAAEAARFNREQAKLYAEAEAKPEPDEAVKALLGLYYSLKLYRLPSDPPAQPSS